ncbi:MAG: hypothetical protein QOI24_431 [Acidobacteriota bacterium]|jgi:hypothetical protein|nr:hypothetical protein [Acidobacteriota bacterium]
MRKLIITAAALIAIGAHAQNITIAIDAAADRHPISADVYGVAFATRAQLVELNVPLNRSGGNAETRYNWQLNASNRAADWFFESIGETSALAGGHIDAFIGDTKAAGAKSMITIPIIGWAAKLGPNRAKLAAFSVAKYGAQQWTDPYMPDAGNGVLANGTRITNNDPHDANEPVDENFQRSWVQQLVTKWGPASNIYLLDNEHSLWQETHRDVHPTGATMDEVFAKMTAHANAIKAVDPNALVAGPEEWGWSRYILSGFDQQWGASHGWTGYPDRAAHGGADYAPWLLAQFRAHEQVTGQRLLDIFTLHYYPQGGEFSDDTSSSMQLRRNRSTRSLWDPNYKDETWIDDKVQLIPRMKSWVATNYPGTKIGMTEYNWGAESHMNGATTQADILGIFGREGLDYATRWTTPGTGSPVFNAFRMYRNYDGAKSAFGEVSVRATAPNADDVSSFAAIRASDGALTIMLIAKSSAARTVMLNVAHFSAGASAQRWQLASNAITRVADVQMSALTLTLPAQSVTLLVIPAASAARRRTAGR